MTKSTERFIDIINPDHQYHHSYSHRHKHRDLNAKLLARFCGLLLRRSEKLLNLLGSRRNLTFGDNYFTKLFVARKYKEDF